MSLKNIRQNYSKLLSAFQTTGIKLTESQKTDLDSFILALESQIEQTKQATISATKKLVEAKLEKQYKTVVESILKHQGENAKLASKIQMKTVSANESKKIARAVSNYLDLYVESVLPEKTIVDYDRMQKLENVFESLKDTLLINDESVESKKMALQEAFSAQTRILESKIQQLQTRLNESMKKEVIANKTIDIQRAVRLVESKTADLPELEAKMIKSRLTGATLSEVEKKFDKILDSVKREVEAESTEDELSLEDEVTKIIEQEDAETLKQKEKKEVVAKESEKVEDDEDDDVVESKEDQVLSAEPTEEDEDDEDDVDLPECDKIDESIMSQWIDRIGTITTRGY